MTDLYDERYRQATLYSEVMELAWLALVDELVAQGQLDGHALVERMLQYGQQTGGAVGGGLIGFAHEQHKILRKKYGIATVAVSPDDV